MSDQTKNCEACFGTGNEPRMRSVQPGRKILFHPCPGSADRRCLVMFSRQVVADLSVTLISTAPVPLLPERLYPGPSDEDAD